MKIVLINMPFASLSVPSLALTQLSAVLESFGDRVRTETLYLNMDFARTFGDTVPYSLALDDVGFMTGVGDWFFRQVAFPDAEDNTDAYFARYYFGDDEVSRARRRALETKREGVADFLDERIAAHDLAQADIVGFTTLFAQTAASFAMAARLKRVNPELVTVIGGAACEGVMGREFAARVPQIDYVFSGPGLVSFPRFVQCRLEGDTEACAHIDGVFSRAKTADAAAQVGEDLDINLNVRLDYGPFLDKLDESFPEGDVRPCLLFETSRGCFWAERSVCTFCGLNGLRRHHRCMTPQNAMAQMRSLFEWVHRCPNFIAVDTVLPRDYLEDVFPVLGAPADMKMMYEVRPDLNEAEINLLYQAGVVALQPGIESLSTATLKLMCKGTTAFGNIAFLKATAKHASSLDWNLLVFSPGEEDATYEKYVRDLPLLMHLAPPKGAFPINFARYSRYFEAPEAYGLALEPQDFHALTYPFPQDSIWNIAQHFVDRNADMGRQDAWLGVLNEATDHWRDRWLGRDGKPQARLCLLADESGASVYDSRSGEEVEHSLTLLAGRVLRRLARPSAIEDLSRAFRDVSGFDAAGVIAYLEERGLLFEEDGRYMSLVVE